MSHPVSSPCWPHPINPSRSQNPRRICFSHGQHRPLHCPTLRHAGTFPSFCAAPSVTSAHKTKPKTHRAASAFSTKIRAAVPFGAFRISTSQPRPGTTRYAPEPPWKDEHSAPVVAIARARSPGAFWHFTTTEPATRNTKANHASRPAPLARLIIVSVSAVITASFFAGTWVP